MTGSLQIKKRKSGDVYYAVLTLQNNKKKWINLNLPVRNNKRLANEKLQKLIEEYSQKNVTEKILFVDYCDNWLKSMKGTVEDVTFVGYETALRNHIKPYFQTKGIYIGDMTIGDIEDYYNYKSETGRADGKEGGLSHRSIKLHSVIMGQVFKRAFYLRDIKSNPVEYAKLPKEKKKTSVGNYYTVDECYKILEALKGSPVYEMVYVTLFYGLRRSELLGLQWKHIDFNTNTLEIAHTVVLSGKKTTRKDRTKNLSSYRTYPLLPEIKTIFLRLRNQQNQNKLLLQNAYYESDYVFTKEDGSLYYTDYPTQMFRKIIGRTDLPLYRFHDLRHSTASILLQKGWSMKDISEWLGHSSINITMNTYTHIDIRRKKELSQSIENMFDTEKPALLAKIIS